MKKEWLFFIGCLVLGIVAEATIFIESIGISYSVFIAAFYSFFFYQHRKRALHHKQINGFLFLAIWVLTLTFTIYSNPIFYGLNYLLLPILVVLHTVLLTSSKKTNWYTSMFVVLIIKKISQFFHFLKVTSKFSGRKLKRRVNEDTYQTGKKVCIGIIISIPLLFVITTLLSSADEKFSRVLSSIPDIFFSFQTDILWRVLFISFLTILFYCYLKVVGKKTNIATVILKERQKNWDAIIVTTILLVINLIYVLFIAVQFQYFFSGTLQNGLSYAEYARKGFFELLLVTCINYVILIFTMSFTIQDKFRMVKVLLSLLIVCSSVLLGSAFIRLLLYEAAYGFTYTRIFAHAAMIYLFVMFVYTLIKVWANRLILSRFYLMSSLLFYVGLNIVGIDQYIVTKNIERYEETGKIDIEYLGNLSYTVIPPLVELYEKNPNVNGLKLMLENKKRELKEEKATWQSYNLSRERGREALSRLE
ncbi:DUF4153 domain-containing protein [Sutcliffiella halmapala]|uniref:DUF4153 domain-containing protein n=1 Tax=Sutcliffiella halmapala TaxID=79882 RepID=UPI0009949B9C|nr:DUF4173 domain-containing protein [Sutcliffiella halmapala]